VKEEGVELVSCHQPSKGLEPTDGAFNDPPLAVPTQWAAILSGRPSAASAMGTDQFDAVSGQTLSQRIAICGAVIDESSGDEGGDGLIEQRLDESNFRGARAVDVDRQRQAGTVDQKHELSALAPLRGTNQIAPFFAGANVPSAKPCSQSISPRRSSCSSNRRQAWSHTPLLDHSTKRLQQVTYEGNDRGKSFQRAPLRSTHRIPSRHRRALHLGRPPRGSDARIGKQSEISSHCSSVSCSGGRFEAGFRLDPTCSTVRVGINGLLSSIDTKPNTNAFSYQQEDL
jgi:hypothetical protein